MGNIDAKNVILQIGQTTIESNEFADSAIQVTAGGDACETTHGLAGGKERKQLYTQEDLITFSLFQSSSSLVTLRSYYKNRTSNLFVIVKDLNADSARAYSSINCQIKSIGDEMMGTADGVQIVVDCSIEGLRSQT